MQTESEVDGDASMLPDATAVFCGCFFSLLLLTTHPGAERVVCLGSFRVCEELKEAEPGGGVVGCRDGGVRYRLLHLHTHTHKHHEDDWRTTVWMGCDVLLAGACPGHGLDVHAGSQREAVLLPVQ